MDNVIQLNKDIEENRAYAIIYNERVLRGVISSSEYHTHMKEHKELKARIDTYLDSTKHVFTAHGKRRV